MIFNRNAGGLRLPRYAETACMVRLLAPLVIAATILATSAFAQTPPSVHKATVGDVRVSGVAATVANTGASVDSVTNMLNNFSDVQPATPVLPAPGRATQPGANKDCAGPSC